MSGDGALELLGEKAPDGLSMHRGDGPQDRGTGEEGGSESEHIVGRMKADSAEPRSRLPSTFPSGMSSDELKERRPLWRSMTQSDAELSRLSENGLSNGAEDSSDDSSVLSNTENTEWDSDFDEDDEDRAGYRAARKSSIKKRCSSTNIHLLDEASDTESAADGGKWAMVRQVWTDLSLIVKLVILIVTPFAARQLGSWAARRMWTRWFGRI